VDADGKPVSSGRIDYALSTARTLNEVINQMTEEELQQALRIESAARRRQYHLERLVLRLSVIQAQRIKDDLTQEYAPWLVKSLSS
jgi:hypothetical protein